MKKKILIRQTEDGKIIRISKAFRISNTRAFMFPSVWARIFCPDGLLEVEYKNDTGQWIITPLGNRKIREVDGTVIGTDPFDVMKDEIAKSTGTVA